uniref:Family with sequence similarity 8 member A1a n=1 Tax=Scleropages formosus TaxID=113540 RepID=A0A8C9R3E2_SCLFO
NPDQDEWVGGWMDLGFDASLNPAQSVECACSHFGEASLSASEYCARLRHGMCQYHCGYVSWHSWLAVCGASELLRAAAKKWSVIFCEIHKMLLEKQSSCFRSYASAVLFNSHFVQCDSVSHSFTVIYPLYTHTHSRGFLLYLQGYRFLSGREHAIPSPLRRFLAEAVDFPILFCVKAAVILTIAHLSGWRDPSKFAVHFIVEEMDEETSLEELQKMMLLPLLYRMLVRLCETFCIWGAGGATPGKFLLGLRVVTCDTSVLVQPDRVQAVPASDVSLSASTVRALNKNFSIAFFFPAFIAPLFFQHNGTVYDIAAGTVVVKRSRAR